MQATDGAIYIAVPEHVGDPVLMDWCRANGIEPLDVPLRSMIEITAPVNDEGKCDILFERILLNREGRRVVRADTGTLATETVRFPLLVEVPEVLR